MTQLFLKGRCAVTGLPPDDFPLPGADGSHVLDVMLPVQTICTLSAMSPSRDCISAKLAGSRSASEMCAFATGRSGGSSLDASGVEHIGGWRAVKSWPGFGSGIPPWFSVHGSSVLQ